MLTVIYLPFVSKSSLEVDLHLLNDFGQRDTHCQHRRHPHPHSVSGLTVVATMSCALMEGGVEDMPLFSL
jgi:hypothetical protein